MEPVSALELDNMIIGYVIKKRRQVLHQPPSSKDVGKPLAIIAILQESGKNILFYPTMLRFKPAIFGGYAELRNEGFLDHPVSLRKAAEIGRERHVWTFYRKGQRYRGLTIAEDFSVLKGRCDIELIDKICEISGWDLLQLSSVQTARQTYRCIRFDTSVYYNKVNEGLDIVNKDSTKAVFLFKEAAKAAQQACFKLNLRRDFLSRYNSLVRRYGEIIILDKLPDAYNFKMVEMSAIENRLFMDLTRSVFANAFRIGERDGISTSQRLEMFLTAPMLTADPISSFEVYDAIERRDSARLSVVIDRMKESNNLSELDSLVLKTAGKALSLFENKPSLKGKTENELLNFLSFRPRYPGEELVVDGANFAFDRGRPGFHRLGSIINDLRKRGFKLTILIDHSVMLALEKKCTFEQISFLHENVTVVPAGRKADEYILDYANINNLRVVSGDMFREYKSRFPWVLSKRLVKPAASLEGQVFSYGIND